MADEKTPHCTTACRRRVSAARSGSHIGGLLACPLHHHRVLQHWRGTEPSRGDAPQPKQLHRERDVQRRAAAQQCPGQEGVPGGQPERISVHQGSHKRDLRARGQQHSEVGLQLNELCMGQPQQLRSITAPAQGSASGRRTTAGAEWPLLCRRDGGLHAAASMCTAPAPANTRTGAATQKMFTN